LRVTLPTIQAAPLENGTLSDISPTMLALLGMETPPEMTGRNLVSGK
jgi:bisphosphoglycerate-independent phosphoglycerate mutase (AlkP superfamily)